MALWEGEKSRRVTWDTGWCVWGDYNGIAINYCLPFAVKVRFLEHCCGKLTNWCNISHRPIPLTHPLFVDPSHEATASKQGKQQDGREKRKSRQKNSWILKGGLCLRPQRVLFMSAFPVSSRFTAAMALANKIPLQKFPLVLKRVLSKLHLGGEVEYFTKEELTKLSEAFALSMLELNDVLGALSYAHEQAAYVGLKPDALASVLVSAKLDVEHADAMARVWAEEAQGVVARIRDSSIMGAPAVLRDNSWSLSINMSNSSLQNTKDASARFELDLARPDGSDAEMLALEFSHAELYQFFKKLETVQQQLDDVTT